MTAEILPFDRRNIVHAGTIYAVTSNHEVLRVTGRSGAHGEMLRPADPQRAAEVLAGLEAQVLR